jgi:hypothetical protein
LRLKAEEPAVFCDFEADLERDLLRLRFGEFDFLLDDVKLRFVSCDFEAGLDKGLDKDEERDLLVLLFGDLASDFERDLDSGFDLERGLLSTSRFVLERLASDTSRKFSG